MTQGCELVSVIVPTLGRESLRPLLQGLARQRTSRPFEVVLVPQGPLAPDLPLAANVRVVPAPPGLGYAVYRNAGIEAARGDPICFVDDDAAPDEDWLETIVADVVAGRHDAATSDLRIPLGRGYLADAISLLGFPGGAAAGWRTMWPVAEDGTTRHLCTGNCALSRAALQAVGTFDVDLGDGSEDVDLGDRLTAGGHTIRYVEAARVRHEPRTGLGRFLGWHLRRGRSGGDLARKKPIADHVRGRLASSLRILLRSLPSRHAPAVAGLLVLQYLAQGLGYLRARYGHRPAPPPAPGPDAPDPGTPLVTVLVPTLNRRDDVARCLDAMREQTYERHEVIVVDNGCADGTPGLVTRRAAEDGRVRLVREGEPGLGHARNRGIREARGAIIALLDDDSVPPSGWLEAIVRGFARPAIGACGGPARPLWAERVHHLIRSSRRARAYLGEYDRGPRPTRVDWLIGANCAYRREVFETCGPFRTDTDRVGDSLRSGGDVEMGLRVGRRHEIRYEPDAWVDHAVSREKLSWRYLFRVAFAIGRSRGADDRGQSGTRARGLSLLDAILGGAAGAGFLLGRLERRSSSPSSPHG